MKNNLMKLSIAVQSLMKSEEGQDLIEYALLVALVAFAATVGMTKLATGINTAFQDIATTLTTYIGGGGGGGGGGFF